METPNPVAVLEQRIEFLIGVIEVAQLCNWSSKDIQELKEHTFDRLVEIDNIRYDLIMWGEEVANNEYSEERANYMWNVLMEQLRKDLSLILGVKIKYV